MNIRVGILTAPHIDYEQGAKSFVLHNVRIGIGFHWDRYEDQEFAGQLEVIRNADGTETAVNIIDLEDFSLMGTSRHRSKSRNGRKDTK